MVITGIFEACDTRIPTLSRDVDGVVKILMILGRAVME